MGVGVEVGVETGSLSEGEEAPNAITAFAFFFCFPFRAESAPCMCMLVRATVEALGGSAGDNDEAEEEEEEEEGEEEEEEEEEEAGKYGGCVFFCGTVTAPLMLLLLPTAPNGGCVWGACRRAAESLTTSTHLFKTL